jgi:DNA-binding NtrC family response regulator
VVIAGRTTAGLAQTFSPVAARSYPRARWTDDAGPHEMEIVARVTVGASPRADMTIADPAVSSLHAELELRDDGVWVRDLGSRNGTYIDRVAVVMARVPEGGSIQLGRTTIALERARGPSVVDLWPESRFFELVGASVPMRELFMQLARVAKASAPVLIQGETGTGKELVASAIHEASPRAKSPFGVVDCGALPETLLEGELFGHARGAFTGAVAARAGAFESAEGGTLFLDEIGELPLGMQPKLLRVLETKTVRRLGENNHRKIDVRFVAATHRDLRSMVNQGTFREDLYFRLAVLPVTIPPLRNRREDIPFLLEHFLTNETELPDPEALRQIGALPLAGNVRELRNLAERARALGWRAALEVGRQPATTSPTAAAAATSSMPGTQSMRELREEAIERFEREYLAALLARHQRDVTAAAQAAGVTPTYIYRLIRKYRV